MKMWLYNFNIKLDLTTLQKSTMTMALVMSVLIVALDLKEFVFSLFPKPYKESWFSIKRNLLAQEKFYRTVHFLVVILTILLCSVILNMGNGNPAGIDMTYLQVSNKTFLSI